MKRIGSRLPWLGVCGMLVVAGAAAVPFANAVSARGVSGSCSSTGHSQPGLQSPEVPTTPGYHPSYAFSGATQPTVLDACDVGIPNQANYGVSDVSAISLPGGKIRLYFCEENGGNPSGIYSAISSDGVHFTLEPGERVTSGCSPLVYRLPDGDYRMFYDGQTGVVSATSSNGLTFTPDPGVRIAATAFGEPVNLHAGNQTSFNSPVCTAIVPLSGGRYRMYCAQVVPGTPAIPGSAGGESAIFSATSSNLLDWTPDPGRRLGPGTAINHDCQHPTAVSSNPDGSATLICFATVAGQSQLPGGGRFYYSDEIFASSANGLTFTQQADTGITGTEASAVKTTSGALLLYYGGKDWDGDGSWAIDLARANPSR